MPKRTSKTTARAAQTRRAVGRTAERAPGQGSTTTQSSDWLAEREGAARNDPPEAGVPIGTGKESIAGRGQAVESRRGAHKSG